MTTFTQALDNHEWSSHVHDVPTRVHIQRSLSTRDKLGVDPLSLIQRSLSTRDKLGVDTVEPLYKGQAGGGPVVPYTAEPLYKGQVGGGYSGASLQGTSWGWTHCPLYSGASLQGTSWGCPLKRGFTVSSLSEVWGYPSYLADQLQGSKCGDLIG